MNEIKSADFVGILLLSGESRSPSDFDGDMIIEGMPGKKIHLDIGLNLGDSILNGSLRIKHVICVGDMNLSVRVLGGGLIIEDVVVYRDLILPVMFNTLLEMKRQVILQGIDVKGQIRFG